MIIIDFNSLFYYRMLGASKNELDNPNIARNILLQDFKYYKNRFKTFGDIILCSDSGDNWRRDTFPQYKISRRKSREDDPEKWKKIFNTQQILWSEFKENLPYKCIKVDRCEGDDIIAVLVTNIQEKNIIISTDKDFKQLLNNNISMYMFSKNEILKPENNYISQHILKGDVSDGVPNIYSNDDFYTLENRPRQKSIKKDLVESFNINDISMFEEEIQKNIKRNQLMIDLTLIPEDIQNSIWMSYNETKAAMSLKYRQYIFKHKLTNLMT